MKHNTESSYKKNNFDDIFKQICLQVKPISILEVGILDGYSLNSFTSHTDKETQITAIDLFEDYQYKNSNFKFIKNLFDEYQNVKIYHDNFYEYYKKCENFDIIHIDISNDAETFKFSLKNYLPKVNKLLILEGGSKERDGVDWMKKYKKPRINDYLMNLDSKYNFEIIDKFPSITIFYKDPINKLNIR